MAERCVEAVLRDGVPVGSILALTFTEKAAGELRERIRRRFLALGEEEHAREVDAGWIGTIHGFCARVLRSRPLAAGLDPRFEVLDEGAARAARARRLRARLRGVGGRARARRRSTSPPPSAPGCATSCSAPTRRCARAARRGRCCRSRRRRRRRTRPSSPPRARRPRAASRRPATGSGSRRRSTRWRPASACSARAGRAGAGRARAPASSRRARRRSSRSRARAYRAAWTAYRQGCADHHARLALIEIADLLARFGAAYAEAKAARAGLDFEDLELGVRDLLAADAAGRERWAERFRLIMVDEFQDTNRLQLDVLEMLERDNLFAVGDEFQSIYGFRHADVTIFRERRAALGEERVRPLTANFRSREELLDVLNGAFAPQWTERFAPLLAGIGSNGSGELRLFDPGEPGDTEPRVELLVTDARGWEDDDRLGLAGVEAKPHRRAEARVIAHRLRRELDAGRAARDIVVLVRATASLRLFEEALEEQGVPTYVVGGRGYWSQQPVRDGLAYLAALANPLDEEALLGVARLPVLRRGSDALILLSAGERACGRRCAPAPRDGCSRSPSGRGGRVRRVLRRRARARRAAPGRGAARAGARGDRLRPRRARPRRRRAAARQPAQADAAGARVRARRGARPARLPRLRRDARPRRRPRGRGAAGVRGPRRRAADDDPPRQGARVPGRVRGRPRPPGRRPDRAAAARRRRLGRAAALDARRRRDGARAGLRAARAPTRPRRRTPRSGGCSTSP